MGLKGALHTVVKIADGEPDFLGTIGRDRGLFVTAWKDLRGDELCGLILEIEGRACSPYDTDHWSLRGPCPMTAP